MTRKEVIAELDAELSRLIRARDFLAAALTGPRKNLMRKIETRLPQVLLSAVQVAAPKKPRKPPLVASAPAVASVPAPEVVAAPVSPAKQEPAVKRVPPRRRMERRQQAEKAGKSTAALSGLVPSGPVAVSADEARKRQEKPAPAQPMPVSELRSEIGAERSLGSLIQAFERRSGLNGLEIP